LQKLGVRAVEVEFPGAKRRQTANLREWAAQLGLAVTGGSDCHGTGASTIGKCTMSADELTALRRQTGGS
jgi:hypothetical protein